MNTFLIVGLGNIGQEFVHTRHNVGERVLRAWVDHQREKGVMVSNWNIDKEVQGEVCSVDIPGVATIWLLFPHTMMNDSGRSVAAFLRMHPVSESSTLIVHDDLETPFGEVRLKQGGSAKGHNGVRSIQDLLGHTNTSRLLIGIGRPQSPVPVEAFVLQKFSESEESELLSAISRAQNTIDSFVGL